MKNEHANAGTYVPLFSLSLEKSTPRMSNYELLYWVDLEGPVRLELVSKFSDLFGHKRVFVPETGFQLITVKNS